MGGELIRQRIEVVAADTGRETLLELGPGGLWPNGLAAQRPRLSLCGQGEYVLDERADLAG